MGVNVSNEFHRTSANPIDDSLVLSSAEMLAMNDNLMPEKYFAVSKTDGCLYLYDKSATPNQTTGKFTKFEGGSIPKVDGFTGNTIKRYAVCDTAAATATKVVTIADADGAFSLETGVILVVKFTNANTATSTPTLNVSSTGAKNIYYNGTQIIANNGYLLKGIITFVYDGTQYQIIGGVQPMVDGITGNKINRFAECTCERDEPSLTASVTNGTFVVETGATVIVRFTNNYSYTGVSSAPMLNIGNTGGLTIYYNGSQVTTTSVPSAADIFKQNAIITFVCCKDNSDYKYEIIGGFDEKYELPAATLNALGGIQTGYTYNLSYPTQYPVTLDSNDNAFATVPNPTVDGFTGNTIKRYVECSTAAATAIKVISVGSNFTLESGSILVVKFNNANTATTNPQLRVNIGGTTGTAKNIYCNGSLITANYGGMLSGIVTFVYDGTYYQIIGRSAIQQIDGLTGDTIKRYVECTTAADSTPKVVTLDKGTNGAFTLAAGVILVVNFRNANTFTNAAPTLRVDVGTTTGTAKQIYINGTTMTGYESVNILKGIVTFVYDGTGYHVIGKVRTNIDGVSGDVISHYATCSTAAATAAKTATMLTGSKFDISRQGSIVVVKFNNANTATTAPTLNVGSTGAKNIYYNDTQITADNGYLLKGIITFVYDGTQYQIIGGISTLLSDALDSTSGVNDGYAATPYAVKKLADMFTVTYEGLTYYCEVTTSYPYSWFNENPPQGSVVRWISDEPTTINTGDTLVIQTGSPIQFYNNASDFSWFIFNIGTSKFGFCLSSYNDNRVKYGDAVSQSGSTYTLKSGSVITFKKTGTQQVYSGGNYINISTLDVYAIGFSANQATDTHKGLVMLTDTIGNTLDVSSGVAVTPKAVYDYVQQAIAQALGNN